MNYLKKYVLLPSALVVGFATVSFANQVQISTQNSAGSGVNVSVQTSIGDSYVLSQSSVESAGTYNLPASSSSSTSWSMTMEPAAAGSNTFSSENQVNVVLSSINENEYNLDYFYNADLQGTPKFAFIIVAGSTEKKVCVSKANSGSGNFTTNSTTIIVEFIPEADC